MKKVRIATIGYGNRGRLYSSFVKDHTEDVEYVAICDIRAKELKESIDKLNVKYVFDNEDDFFNAKLDLDLLLICSMDQYHYQQAIKGLNAGYNLLLEKPIAENMEQVNEIYELAKAKNLKVIVCYVLRYTPFYRSIKDIISSGEIGDIVNINTTENVGYWHYAHSYVRGNWANSDETSPMILAKCSHDLDLIYWLMNKKMSKLSSFGDLSYFKVINAPKGSTSYCTDCPLKDTCAFNCYYFYLNNPEWLRPMIGDDLSKEKIMEFLNKSQYSRCVFKCNNNVVDHQVLNIEFEDKSTASHTMVPFTRYCYRDIKVMGTKGFIEGNFEEKKFKVYNFLNNVERTVDISNTIDKWIGHGGGDPILFDELIEYIKTGHKTESLTSLEESVVSHLACFSAEASRINDGKVIDLNRKDK